MVNNKDIQRVILEKAKMDAENQRETTVTIEGNGVISIGGKTVAKKPVVKFKNTYAAKNDFVACSLRMVLKDYFSGVQRQSSIIVRKEEADYVIKVSKLKSNIELEQKNSRNVLISETINFINNLDGLFVVGNENNYIIVSTNNFQQYKISIIKKRERVIL